jgi:hypothetical protein
MNEHPHVIWKFEVSLRGTDHTLPRSATVIAAAIDEATPDGHISIWVENPIMANGNVCAGVPRRFECYGTGMHVPGHRSHCGTVTDTRGNIRFVWHVYERT